MTTRLATAIATLLMLASAFGQSNDVNALLAKAKAGDAKAQHDLGHSYRDGTGVEKDPAEAVKWFRKSAEQGDFRAQYDLGDSYQNGIGVEKDPAKAVKWFLKSAEQGDARAQFELGRSYYDGMGVEKDSAEAVKWFLKAAEQGKAQAQYNLGWLYEHGKGVEKNVPEAVKWYRKAAEQGNAWAQLIIGLCYEQGYGMPRDTTEAVTWYQKAAAKHGDFAAYFACYQLRRSKVWLCILLYCLATISLTLLVRLMFVYSKSDYAKKKWATRLLFIVSLIGIAALAYEIASMIQSIITLDSGIIFRLAKETCLSTIAVLLSCLAVTLAYAYTSLTMLKSPKAKLPGDEHSGNEKEVRTFAQYVRLRLICICVLVVTGLVFSSLAWLIGLEQAKMISALALLCITVAIIASVPTRKKFAKILKHRLPAV